MARKLKKLRIGEISAVDAGAGIGCRVLLMKRHKPDEGGRQMEKQVKKEIRKFEKRERRLEKAMAAAIASARRGDPRLIMRPDAYVIAKIAEMPQHAELWREYRSVEALAKLGGGDLPHPGPGRMANTNNPGAPRFAPPVRAQPFAPQPVHDVSGGPALESLVDSFHKQNPRPSRAQAYSRVMDTPAGAAAYHRERETRLLTAVGAHRQLAVVG